MRLSFIALALTAFLSSCGQSVFQNYSNQKLPKSNDAKSYALAINDEVPNSEDLKKQLHLQMSQQNYYYDPASPDYLVMGTFYDQNIEILTGNKYASATQELKIESNKVRTAKHSLLLQIVDTETYAIVWRGLSSSRNFNFEPMKMAYRTNSLMNE